MVTVRSDGTMPLELVVACWLSGVKVDGGAGDVGGIPVVVN